MGDVWAKAATHHGWLIFLANGAQWFKHVFFIWQHTHTITTTEVSPDLGEFTEILDDVSVEMIPLRYC